MAEAFGLGAIVRVENKRKEKTGEQTNRDSDGIYIPSPGNLALDRKREVGAQESRILKEGLSLFNSDLPSALRFSKNVHHRLRKYLAE